MHDRSKDGVNDPPEKLRLEELPSKRTSMIEQISMSQDIFYQNYNKLSTCLVLSELGLRMLIGELEYISERKVDLLASYRGMDIIHTVREDLLFELL